MKTPSPFYNFVPQFLLLRTHNFLRLLLTTSVLFGLFLFLDSCKDEDPAPPTVIEFESVSQEITEGQNIIVKIKLSATVPQPTLVVVNISGDATYTNDFNTNPSGNEGFLVAEVFNGAATAQFTVSTVDDEIFEGDKTVTLTLGAAPDGFEIGTQKTITLTIKDNESPAIANFEISTATINENGTSGITVKIPFSLPAKGEGNVTVSMASISAIYGTNYTTLPAAVGNSISFAVVNQATGVTFTVVPKDDSFFHSDFVIVFEITSTTGSVRIGTVNKFTLTIKEDESPSLANFNLPNASIAENTTTPITVQIPLSIPASETGSVTATLTSTNATYGTNFTTSPVAAGGNIVINVAKNATQVEFTVLPIDDAVDNANRKIIFTLSAATGVVRLGPNLVYELTITDNEPTLRKILISFGTSKAPLVTGADSWNHVYGSPQNGDLTWSNLVRSDGVATTIGVLVNSVLTPQDLGKTTGINSGVFPDNALKEYWYVPVDGATRGFSITLLDNSKLYTIKIHGGTTFTLTGENAMIISVNGTEKTIADVTNNVSEVLTWADVVPAAAKITVNLTDGSGICPINAMELSWYEE